MVLIAHMADIHLGRRQYGILEREKDIYEVFEEAVDRIIEERVEVLVLAGDIFDNHRPPVMALGIAKSMFRRLSDRGVKILAVLGEHDQPRRIDELPPTTLFDEVIHIGQQNLEVSLSSGAVLFTGLDRVPASIAEERLGQLAILAEAAAARRCRKVLVAHVPIEHGSAIKANLLPRGYDYYALGHEHCRLIFELNTAKAGYPGSLEVLSREEIAYLNDYGKGFFLIDLSGGEPQIHKINLTNVRPQVELQVSYEELDAKLLEVKDWASRQAKKPLVHVAIRGRNIDSGKVSKVIQEKLGLYVLGYRFEISEDGGEDLEGGGGTPRLDLRSIIREYLESRGLGGEGVELGLAIYEAYRSRGEEGLEELIEGVLE